MNEIRKVFKTIEPRNEQLFKRRNHVLKFRTSKRSKKRKKSEEKAKERKSNRNVQRNGTNMVMTLIDPSPLRMLDYKTNNFRKRKAKISPKFRFRLTVDTEKIMKFNLKRGR